MNTVRLIVVGISEGAYRIIRSSWTAYTGEGYSHEKSAIAML